MTKSSSTKRPNQKGTQASEGGKWNLLSNSRKRGGKPKGTQFSRESLFQDQGRITLADQQNPNMEDSSKGRGGQPICFPSLKKTIHTDQNLQAQFAKATRVSRECAMDGNAKKRHILPRPENTSMVSCRRQGRDSQEAPISFGSKSQESKRPCFIMAREGSEKRTC